MKINFDKNSVVIFGKSYKLDVLVRKFAILSGDQIFHFLSNRRIQMPRAVNVMALTALLNKKIVTLSSNDLTKEEFERLQYYPYFTEEQLFRLAKKLGLTDEEFEEYRMYLFKLIIENFEGLDITDGEISYLKSLKKLPIESFDKYFNYISAASLETKTSFDGRELEDLEKYFPLTATNEDINDLCEKYGLEIPYELDHQQFYEYANYYLSTNNQMSRAVALELQRMSFEQLATYCDRINLPMHVNMNTEERARYLLFYLSMCDISKTVIDNIVADDSYYPIEFSVDFDKLENDNNSVIILKSNENVIEELEAANDELIEETPEETASQEIPNNLEEPVEEVYENIPEENNLKNEELNAIETPEVVEEVVEETPVEEVVEEAYKEATVLEETPEDVYEEVAEETPTEEVIESPQEENLEEEYSNDGIIYPENNPFEEELNLDSTPDYSEDGYVEFENEEAPTEETVEEEEAPLEVDEETEALINSILEEDEEEKEKEVPFEKDEGLSNVIKNEQFGDKKLLKLKEGKAKMIILLVILGLALAGIAFCLIAYFCK